MVEVSRAAGLEAYETPGRAAAYRHKYAASLLRRLSHRREMRMLGRALRHAGASGPVLDCPCGAGRLVPVLRTAGPVVGADLSGSMLVEARAATGGGVPLLRTSAFALPFATGAFDTAVCWRLLHHLPRPADRARVLAELSRVARRAVVVSFSDAGTVRAWVRRRSGRAHGSVQSLLTRDQLAVEARAAGLSAEGFWRLGGLVSVVAAAVLRKSSQASGAPQRLRL